MAEEEDNVSPLSNEEEEPNDEGNVSSHLSEDSVDNTRVEHQIKTDFYRLKIDLKNDIEKYGSIYDKLYKPFHDPAYKAEIAKIKPKYLIALQLFRIIINRIKYISPIINDPSESYTVKLDLQKEYVGELHGKLDGIYKSICKYPQGGPICDQIETRKYNHKNKQEIQRRKEYLIRTQKLLNHERRQKQLRKEEVARRRTMPPTLVRMNAMTGKNPFGLTSTTGKGKTSELTRRLFQLQAPKKSKKTYKKKSKKSKTHKRKMH